MTTRTRLGVQQAAPPALESAAWFWAPTHIASGSGHATPKESRDLPIVWVFVCQAVLDTTRPGPPLGREPLNSVETAD